MDGGELVSGCSRQTTHPPRLLMLPLLPYYNVQRLQSLLRPTAAADAADATTDPPTRTVSGIIAQIDCRLPVQGTTPTGVGRLSDHPAC